VDYFHLKKLVDLGGANVVHSYEELKTELLKYIVEPNHDLARRQHALKMECHLNDGQATTRVIEALNRIIASLNPVHA